MQEVLDKLNEMQIESMKLKLQIKEDIHKIDNRLVSLETKFKIVVPVVSLFFVAIGNFIKKKIALILS